MLYKFRQPPKFDLSQSEYMWIYGAFGVAQFLAAMVLIASLLYGSFTASIAYHRSSLNSLLLAPMGFFDSQPIGRILNRMSQDIDSIDQQIWMSNYMMVLCLTYIISSMVLLIYIEYRLLCNIMLIQILFYHYSSSFS